MIAIREFAPQDAEALQAFVRELSPVSRRNRFLSAVNELPPAMLEAMTSVDPARHIALAAVEGSRIVGEVRCVALGLGSCGELAIAVADDLQRSGIGARMLQAILAAARRAGLARLEGEVLRTNTAMLEFSRKAGFSFHPVPGEARLVGIDRVVPG